jgi:hypothetical protein
VAKLTKEQIYELHDEYNRDADYPEFRDIHNLLDTIDALEAELAATQNIAKPEAVADQIKAAREEAMAYVLQLYQDAILESMIFCMGCAKGESSVISPRSDVVGLAAVHSSGMICIPRTVQALVAEAHNRAALRSSGEAGESGTGK